jgi:glycosyltransferase involved in cell wall biosynthesis
VIIGTGENAGCQDQTEHLHTLTQSLGLQDRVRFIGRVSDQALLDWYAAADVFALPSSSEAQGIAALEAMACGLPVVASAVGGLLGTIDHGRTGYLVQAGDVAPLRERIQFLLDNPAHAAEIGTAARASVTEHFTWSHAVEQTVDVYREVLGG